MTTSQRLLHRIPVFRQQIKSDLTPGFDICSVCGKRQDTTELWLRVCTSEECRTTEVFGFVVEAPGERLKQLRD
jgi:hypothetical protein